MARPLREELFLRLPYRVNPEICAEADVEAYGEEKASIPVDQDQDQQHNLNIDFCKLKLKYIFGYEVLLRNASFCTDDMK